MKHLLITLAVALSVASINAKSVIVYYSFTNNTHTIALELQTQTDADIVRVEPAEEGLDYAANNYAIGSALIQAIRNNPADAASYPEIKPVNVNIEDYDTIFIGAPLWWSNMAAPLQTYLFHHGAAMAGKHIGLIVSSASSGISGVEADAHRLIPDGQFIEPALWIRSSQTSDCRNLIADWLESINQSTTTATQPATGVSAVTLIASRGSLNIIGTFDSLELFTPGGTRVLRTTQHTISTNHLTPGVYIAVIAAAGGISTHKVLIID